MFKHWNWPKNIFHTIQQSIDGEDKPPTHLHTYQSQEAMTMPKWSPFTKLIAQLALKRQNLSNEFVSDQFGRVYANDKRSSVAVRVSSIKLIWFDVEIAQTISDCEMDYVVAFRTSILPKTLTHILHMIDAWKKFVKIVMHFKAF